MRSLIKPVGLKKGDKVATVSLSWGGAGDKDLLWRYNQGKKRLEEVFGLEVIEMEHTLKGSEFIYNNPQKRAEDLMNAFKDKEIKGIFSCIGGEESIRMLPYIDFEVIKANPKIFIGYSDTTTTHLICMKAGLRSFYGPSILADFAENVEMFEYTKKYIEKVLFSNEVIGEVEVAKEWTSEYLEWDIRNKDTKRKMEKHEGVEVLQGDGKVYGNLIGGCMEVLEMAKGTEIWPKKGLWKDTILFLETSEEMPSPISVERWIRNLGSQGILKDIKGMIIGKPFNNKYYEEYKKVILKVIKNELGLENLPILYNMNFGHTAPLMTIPYGAKAEIDCENKSFSILESGVI